MRWRRPEPHRGNVHERLASWLSDLTTVHALTERLHRTTALGEALRETLRAGAGLLGARRGLIRLQPADGLGPRRVLGLGLSHADLGHIETAAQDADRCAPPFDTAAGGESLHPDIARDPELGARPREVAAHLGCAASYAVPLATDPGCHPGVARRLGGVTWLFDEPGAPEPRQRHLLALYLRHAAQHVANRLELTRARTALRAVRDGLIPATLPAPPGVALAVRHEGGGGGFHDALALPDGSLALAIGATGDTGPAALAATGRLRAGLRAYAVMEGEDPVAVLSDLELLLRLTEPGRSATTLFCYAEPPAERAGTGGVRRLVVASAGHPPPLVVGADRAEFAETALSAPLGMLTCWEAPSLRLDVARGETVLLYSEGLLRLADRQRDGAFARLRATAATTAPEVRADPAALVDHLLHHLAPAPRPAGEDRDLAPAAGAAGTAEAVPEDDVILLAARF